jgi:NAD(P)-dependent dehydrogenase (short-subunit alcohol dehydrogenase family)
MLSRLLSIFLCTYTVLAWFSVIDTTGYPIKYHQRFKVGATRVFLRAAQLSLFLTTLSTRSAAMASSDDGSSIAGKQYLVTGSTDGIGKHTAQRIAASGGNLILHGRNPDKLAHTVKDIQKAYPNIQIRSYCHDLSTTAGAKQLAHDILYGIDQLDGLINNAGIFTSEYKLNEDGIESTFAVNVVAPFILSVLLLPLLQRTRQSRILNVSSTSQEEGNPRIVMDNLQFQRGGFSDHASYSLSKLCVAALSHEFALRVKPSETLVLSCDPGDVDTQMLRAGWAGYQGIPVEEADNEYDLVSMPWNEKLHGKYFVACRPSRCNPDVYNDAKRLALWKELERISGLSLSTV